MTRSIRGSVVLVGVLSAFMVAAEAGAQDWSIFKSDRFGFAMLVAPGTRWEARDYGYGWGGIHAKRGVLEFVAIVKLGSYGTATELGASAVQLTQVPAEYWRKTDEGQNANGWAWWQTYWAENHVTHRVLFAVIGTGRRGSYILFLETSQADYNAKKDLYGEWYRSLTLY